MLIFQLVVLTVYITVRITNGRKIMRWLHNKLYGRSYGRRPEPREFN